MTSWMSDAEVACQMAIWQFCYVKIMGASWRRAFCPCSLESTIADKQQHKSHSPSLNPRSCARLGFLSGGSNSYTPKLQALTSPSLHCRTIAEAAQAMNDNSKFQTKNMPKTPKSISTSNPTSPRSPLKLSLFKNDFKFRSSCSICLNSVKKGQGTTIYLVECALTFHFPYIAVHVHKQGNLVCPMCSATWKEVSLLAVHKNLDCSESSKQNNVVVDKTTIANKKKTKENSSLVFKTKAFGQHHQPAEQYFDSSRCYDNDEPLLSQTFGARMAI